jgi:hypothetical protein
VSARSGRGPRRSDCHSGRMEPDNCLQVHPSPMYYAQLGETLTLIVTVTNLTVVRRFSYRRRFFAQLPWTIRKLRNYRPADEH